MLTQVEKYKWKNNMKIMHNIVIESLINYHLIKIFQNLNIYNYLQIRPDKSIQAQINICSHRDSIVFNM